MEFFTLLALLYRKYLRVKVDGIENVPDRGRAMMVCNHSGGIALDAGMILTSLILEKDPPRLAHAMVDRFAGRWPFAATWLARVGQLTGLPEHALRLLNDDRLLLVFPEGARGTAKLFWQRHDLVRFGTGFLRLALRTGTPLIPMAFLGGGEAIPTMYNSRWLGKVVGSPYVPLTPYLVSLPLPVQCKIIVSKPMHLDGNGNESDEVIGEWVALIKERIAGLINSGLRGFSPTIRLVKGGRAT